MVWLVFRVQKKLVTKQMFDHTNNFVLTFTFSQETLFTDISSYTLIVKTILL